MLAAGAAHAQTSSTLVSNTGQAGDGQSNNDIAQAFTTGSNSGGYKLTAVDIRMALQNAGDTPDYTVTVRSDSAGSPGTSLGTLTTSTTLTTSYADVRFTASGDGIDLDANTTYWVMADVAQTPEPFFRWTNADGEDSGAETGWSIADDGRFRAWNGTNWTTSTRSRMIAIRGYATSDSPTVSSVVLSSNAGGDNTYAIGDNIDATVTFSQSVTVTTEGSSPVTGPRIALTVGTAERHAVYQSGSPGTSIVFRYTVAADDEDTDGVAIAANKLEANGTSTIQSSGGTDATLTHTAVSAQAAHKVDGVRPTVSSATADGTSVKLTFNENLDTTLPVANTFRVNVAGTEKTPTGRSVSGTVLTLTLAAADAVTAGQTVTAKYTKPNTGDTLKDAAGNEAENFARQSVTNNTAPVFSSATVKGATLTITFDASLSSTASHVPAHGQFNVQVAGSRVNVTSGGVSISGSAVTLTLASAVTAGQAVTVAYTQPGTGNKLQDAHGNLVATFSAQNVTNSAAPVFSSATVKGSTLTITFDASLSSTASHVPAHGQFNVQVAGSRVNVTSGGVSISGSAVTLTLASAVTAGQAVTVAYTKPATGNKLQDANGNEVATFSAQNVTNSAAPVFSSATVNGSTLTITFDASLSSTASHVPAHGQFNVQVAGSRVNVTSGGVSISGSAVTLTLASAVTAGQAVTVAYTKPVTGNKLQDANGNEVATFAAQSVTNNTAPAVTGLAMESSPASGDTYIRAEHIEVAVTFDVAVRVTGGPQLELAVGSNNRQAAYNRGHGTTKLVFRYSVAATDTDADGISVGANKLALNDGTISGAGGRAATLTHTALGAQSGHKVDGNLTLPAVSIAGGPAVAEGGGAVFTLTASPAPASTLTVNLTVSQTGSYVATADLGAKTVTVPASGTGTYTVPTVNDSTDEPNGGVGVAVQAGTGYRVDDTDHTASVTVNDNDVAAPPPPPPSRAPVANAGADVEVAPGASVTLDGSGSSDPNGDTLTFAWSQSSGRRVTLAGAGTAKASFTAPDMPGALVFSLTVADPSRLTSSDSVTVKVRDHAPSFGTARVASLTLVLGEAMEPVVLPQASGGNGALSYGLSSDPAGLAGLSFDAAARRLSGTPDTAGRHVFTYRAEDADDNRADSDAAVLTFAVTVDDPRAATVKRAVKRTLAAVARRALTSALDNIGARFAASIPASALTLAGETVPLGAAPAASFVGEDGACPAGAFGSNGPRNAFGRAGCGTGAWTRGVEGEELLHASAFSLTLGAAPGTTGVEPSAPLWSIWGRGDFGSFGGRPEPGMQYDGKLRTGWLGVDARAGPWVAGLAVSHGTGEADYSFDAGGVSGHGRLETTLTALYPYGRWTLSGGLELRGVLGAGRGEVRHQLDGGPRETSDLSMWMGSVGLRHALPSLASVDLAARADASLARMETGDGPDYVGNLTADSWRLRAGLEALRRFALDEDEALTPFVEVAARRDGGDGLTGTGLEIAGGLRYTAPGLQVEARGRWLAAHSEEGAEERGLSVTARMGPGAHGRGLSLMLSPRWGAGTGGADALWRDELPKLGAASGGEAAALDARIGYGFGVAPYGLLTPFAETGLSGAGDSRQLRLGTRFDASHMALGVEVAGERVESGAAGPEHLLKLDLRLRF